MPGKRIIIAIDGPSGTGKGTVARLVAERLGYLHVDSGAMYRAVAFLAMESGVGFEDGEAVGRMASDVPLRFEWRGGEVRVKAGERDISAEIRHPDVSNAASFVAVHGPVRTALVAQQQRLGREGGIVMEGRDIGTVVFPEAELKVYLDASPEERARRRYVQEGAEDGGKTLPETLEEILERDRRDSEREVSPLRQAPGAVYLDTTALGAEEVADVIVRLAGECADR